MEPRKIELHADGSRGFAEEQHRIGGAEPGAPAVPGLVEINADPELEASGIEEAEFQRPRDAARSVG